MSTIDSTKISMGYVPSKKRQACTNCFHAELRDGVHPTWWCDAGNFLTSPLAICSLWKSLYPEAGK